LALVSSIVTHASDGAALFVWLISHQSAVLFSQNKPTTSQQYFSLTTNQHQSSATSQTNKLNRWWKMCLVRVE
jgi:hypothetical protein